MDLFKVLPDILHCIVILPISFFSISFLNDMPRRHPLFYFFALLIIFSGPVN